VKRLGLAHNRKHVNPLPRRALSSLHTLAGLALRASSLGRRRLCRVWIKVSNPASMAAERRGARFGIGDLREATGRIGTAPLCPALDSHMGLVGSKQRMGWGLEGDDLSCQGAEPPPARSRRHHRSRSEAESIVRSLNRPMTLSKNAARKAFRHGAGDRWGADNNECSGCHRNAREPRNGMPSTLL
jgi:hypothetical protein